MILAFFARYKLLFEIIVIGALVAGVAYGIHHFLMYEQEIGAQRERVIWQDKEIKAEEVRRLREQALQEKVDAAQALAAERGRLLAKALATATGSSDGVRGTLATLDARIATATVDAARQYASALSGVFGECQRAFVEMAGKAAGHASDVKTLTDAWPKN